MGYAHRWTRPTRIDDATWSRFKADVETAIRLLQVTASDQWRETGHEPIALRGPDGRGRAVVAADSIAFNGDAKHHVAAEPFVFPQDARNGAPGAAGAAVGEANFSCDTELHPYDAAVCAILLIAQRHLGDTLRITSDGSPTEFHWPVAREIAGTVLRIEAPLAQEGQRIRWGDAPT